MPTAFSSLPQEVIGLVFKNAPAPDRLSLRLGCTTLNDSFLSEEGVTSGYTMKFAISPNWTLDDERPMTKIPDFISDLQIDCSQVTATGNRSNRSKRRNKALLVSVICNVTSLSIENCTNEQVARFLVNNFCNSLPLRRLKLYDCHIGDKGAKAIGSSEILKNLTSLNLGLN